MVDAALGATIDVDGILDGPIELTIPPGTQPGAVITLRGRGMPHLRSEVRGSLHAHVDVVVPAKLDHKDTELLRELKANRHRDVAAVRSNHSSGHAGNGDCSVGCAKPSPAVRFGGHGHRFPDRFLLWSMAFNYLILLVWFRRHRVRPRLGAQVARPVVSHVGQRLTPFSLRRHGRHKVLCPDLQRRAAARAAAGALEATISTPCSTPTRCRASVVWRSSTATKAFTPRRCASLRIGERIVIGGQQRQNWPTARSPAPANANSPPPCWPAAPNDARSGRHRRAGHPKAERSELAVELATEAGPTRSWPGRPPGASPAGTDRKRRRACGGGARWPARRRASRVARSSRTSTIAVHVRVAGPGARNPDAGVA